MNVYVIRHGQTDGNLDGRWGGRIDVPLNEVGIEEVREAKKKFDNIKFDKVYSSPLKRALKTAEILSDGDFIVDDRLIERSNGDLEGTLKSETKVYPNFSDPNETLYHIETDDKIRGRVKAFFDELATHDYDNVLLVTHAGTGIYIRCFFDGDPIDGNFKSYKMKNCEIKQYQLKR